MSVEESVRKFYDDFGWRPAGEGQKAEDVLFRQFSAAYRPYHRRVEARVAAAFAGMTDSLLIAGCGDMPDSHVTLAQPFRDVTLLDISQLALDLAGEKLGGRGQYLNASLLDIPLPDESVQAAYCAHVIYHIDKDQQEQAIRELIRVTRPGGLAMVIYFNRQNVMRPIGGLKRRIPGLKGLERKQMAHIPKPDTPQLYFFTHPIAWFDRFADVADVSMIPWDVMSAHSDRQLLLNEGLARRVYSLAAWFEDRYPDRAARNWMYPAVLFRKR